LIPGIGGELFRRKQISWRIKQGTIEGMPDLLDFCGFNKILKKGTLFFG